MKVLVTVCIHEGEGDLKSAEFTGRFRGPWHQIMGEAAQFTSRSIERAGKAEPEDSQTRVRLTEEEEVQ